MTTPEPLSNRSQSTISIIVPVIVVTITVVAIIAMVTVFAFARQETTAPAGVESTGGQSAREYFAECVATEMVRDLVGHVPDEEIRRRWRQIYEQQLAEDRAARAGDQRVRAILAGGR